MRKLSRAIIFLTLAVLVGGGIFLVTWEIPAPQTPVERILPDERFRR